MTCSHATEPQPLYWVMVKGWTPIGRTNKTQVGNDLCRCSPLWDVHRKKKRPSKRVRWLSFGEKGKRPLWGSGSENTLTKKLNQNTILADTPIRCWWPGSRSLNTPLMSDYSQAACVPSRELDHHALWRTKQKQQQQRQGQDNCRNPTLLLLLLLLLLLMIIIIITTTHALASQNLLSRSNTVHIKSCE